jgi:DNA-directed RNA polymerase III subunit RPC1
VATYQVYFPPRHCYLLSQPPVPLSPTSGKRVDHSGRTVISPDPNLRVDEVAIPLLIAMDLTYPERVTTYNMPRLKTMVANGPAQWPGANHCIISAPNGARLKQDLRWRKEEISENLKIGDVVLRHLIDGDAVLFNRQPSLHRISIMCHRARILPWRTFRFNECCCAPYNADFDGDEMNIHIPQTEEARVEALELMGVKNNLITPRHGEMLIAATQDFLSASFILTRKNMFLDRSQMTYFASFFSDAKESIDLPPPAIIKPARLWTGKQLYSLLFKVKQRHVAARLLCFVCWFYCYCTPDCLFPAQPQVQNPYFLRND